MPRCVNCIVDVIVAKSELDVLIVVLVGARSPRRAVHLVDGVLVRVRLPPDSLFAEPAATCRVYVDRLGVIGLG